MSWTEASRQTRIEDTYDVIVCGGGPAGVAAAVSAGRAGARTLLLELGGCLGGIWTQGMAALALDIKGKGGLMQEIRSTLLDRGGLRQRRPERPEDFLLAGEAMKYLLDELVIGASVDVLFHTRVVAPMVQGDSILGVITEHSGGRTAFAGSIILDCTGSGQLAALAGCGFAAGHPETGKLQPASMLAVVMGIPDDAEADIHKDRFYFFLRELGFEPSSKNRSAGVLPLPYPGLYMFSVNHEFDVAFDSPHSVTQATLRARREFHAAIAVLREKAGWKDLRLLSTSTHIGLREGRRIEGRYGLTLDDMQAGRRFADGICTVHFGVDIHALDPDDTLGCGNQGVEIQPYQIPLRSLIAANYQNLGMAGRCISGDFFAHASYRVTGNAVPMGEALGFAAAVAVQTGRSLPDIDGAMVSAEMRRRGYALALPADSCATTIEA